jgi:hypothetical protein
MANITFDRITKTMAILLALCFVLSVTAVSVNAAALEQRNKFDDHSGKYKHGDKHGHDYKDGNNYGQDYRDIDKYEHGYKDGYTKGLNDGIKDCIKYGSKDFIRKIPDPPNKDNRYRAGFIQGYTIGYHEKRYACLKK